VCTFAALESKRHTRAQFPPLPDLGPRRDLEPSLWARAPPVPLGMDGALLSLDV
jgi:hypothetical protein